MKVYMIVMNDEYERPVQCDVVGMQAVVNYIGYGSYYIWKHMRDGNWKGKYKVIDMGSISEQEEDFEPNEDVAATCGKESIAKKNYYERNKETIKRKVKARYAKKRETICAYNKAYYKDVKEGKRIVNSRNC